MGPKAKDDKTFGMKNKKGSKAQKFIQQVEKQGSGKTKADLAKEKEKQAKLDAKKAEELKKKMEAELFGPVQVQKVPFGTDPKTVLCVFFKAGHCDKGSKCKFSHDLNVERKAEKMNIYEDARDKEVDKKDDLMETWDEDKLRKVVNQNSMKQKTTTDIVCKFFVQAIEEKKYGWFWECPNGADKCHYRHALPPGFVLKSEQKAKEDAEKKDQISLEEFLEVERHKLKPPLTPVTAESFAAWKQNRLDKKKAEQEAQDKAKAAQRAAGKVTGMTGRDMFTFGGELYEDEEEAGEEDWDISRMLARYREEDDRPDEEKQEDERLYEGDEDDGGDDGDGGDEDGANGVVNGVNGLSVGDG